MRLLVHMESWKARGLNVLIVLLLALTFVACDEDRDEVADDSQMTLTVLDNRWHEWKEEKKKPIYKSKKISSWENKRAYKNRPQNKGLPNKISFFSTKNSIEDTLNFTPEEKAKNYQNSFKIWSGVYRLKSQKTASDMSSLKLDENYEIPFVGKTLKIGDKEYSTFEMVELVQKEKTALLNVIASKIKWNGLYFRMDLNELRKGIDSLQTIKEMFSEIDLKVRRDSKSFSNGLERKSLSLNLLNLNTNDRFVEFSISDKLFMEYSPKIKNQKVKLGNLRTETEVDASILTKNTIHYDNGKISFSSDVELFILDFPGITYEKTESLPIGVKWDFLNVSITKNGIEDNVGPIEKVKKVKKVNRVNFPVVDYFEESYNKHFYQSVEDYYRTFEELEIPFLDNLFFAEGKMFYSLKNLIESVDNYSRFVQYLIDSASVLKEGVKGGKIDLKMVCDSMNRYAFRTPSLRNFAIYKKSLDIGDDYHKNGFINLINSTAIKKGKIINLHEQGNVLVFKITFYPLKCIKNVDLGLLKVKKFDADFETFILNRFYILDGVLAFDYNFVDVVNLKLSSPVKEINLGDKKISFGDGSSKNNGKLNYFISIEPDAEDTTKIVKPTMNLDYESLTIMDGDRIVATLNNQNHKERFRYDFNRDKWIIPSSLKPYVTLSKRNMKFDE